jgi:site-specific DNA-adenine methylase
MNNHFIFSYPGNKRNEFKYLHNIINNIDDYDTIIEPFCGSSAISFNIWLKYPNKKFILNDNNNDLIRLYNLIKTEDIETIKNKLLLIKTIINNDKNVFIMMYKGFNQSEDKDIYQYIYFNKFTGMSKVGLYRECKFKDFTKLQYKFFEFIKTANITFMNNDWYDVFKEYSNDKKALIFFDPPYLLSYNMFYQNFNTNIYEFFSNNNIKQFCFKAKLILILENNWIIKLIFKNEKSFIYDKQYQVSKKKTNHIIISN